MMSGSAAVLLVLTVVGCLFGASWKSGSPVVSAVIVVIVVAFVAWLLRRGLARRLDLAYPIGFTATSVTTEAGPRVTNAIGTTEIPWSNMRRPRVMAGAATFAVPTSRLQRVGYPRYLVSDDALARIRGSALN